MIAAREIVVYDILSAPPYSMGLAIIAMFIATAGGMLLIGSRRRWFRHDPRTVRAAGFGCLLFLQVPLGIALIELMGTTRLQHALRTGSYVVVEGRVDNFHPGDRGGHRDESWSVRSGGGVYRYSYRRSRHVPGFHQSAGPIREGLWVRIADVDGRIARLTIPDSSSSSDE